MSIVLISQVSLIFFLSFLSFLTRDGIVEPKVVLNFISISLNVIQFFLVIAICPDKYISTQCLYFGSWGGSNAI